MEKLPSNTTGAGTANTLQEHTVYVLISLTMRITSLETQPTWQKLVHTSTCQLLVLHNSR